MKKAIIVVLGLLFLSALLLWLMPSLSRSPICNEYLKKVESIETKNKIDNEKLKIGLSLKKIDLGTGSSPSEWVAITMGKYILPLPSPPLRKDVTPNRTSLVGDEYLLTIGPGTKVLEPVKNYFARFNVQNEFEFERLIFSGFLSTCEGLTDKADFEVKSRTLDIMAMPVPSENFHVIISEKSRVIGSVGESEEPDPWKYYVNLTVEISDKNVESVFVQFKKKTDRDWFVSSLPNIRNQEFFKRVSDINDL